MRPNFIFLLFYNGKRASDKCKHVNSQDNQLYLMDSYLCNNYVHIIYGFLKSLKKTYLYFIHNFFFNMKYNVFRDKFLYDLQ